MIWFLERGSQDLSNGTNFASQLANLFFCLPIYSLWLRCSHQRETLLVVESSDEEGADGVSPVALDVFRAKLPPGRRLVSPRGKLPKLVLSFLECSPKVLDSVRREHPHQVIRQSPEKKKNITEKQILKLQRCFHYLCSCKLCLSDF
jgi:hypothetical protein